MDQSELSRLPEEIRKSISVGERLIWTGKPDWKSFGYQVFGIKYLGIYFLISAFYVISQVQLSLSAFLAEYIPFIISGLLAAAILLCLAYVTARHTCYVLTEKRIIIRTGVALVFLLNVPSAKS